MEPLDLDAGDYPGTYKLIGGRLALDLVNTVSWPGQDRAHDWLDRSANVTTWLAAVGLPAVAINSKQRLRAVQIRTILDAVIRPLAHQNRPTTSSIAVLSGLAQGALSRRHIDPVTLRWTSAPGTRTAHLFDPVVLDAAELVIDGSGDRLRFCPACDWLFEDHSRNGKRRWCDMIDCGSREKARAYYHRSKSEL